MRQKRIFSTIIGLLFNFTNDRVLTRECRDKEHATTLYSELYMASLTGREVANTLTQTWVAHMRSKDTGLPHRGLTQRCHM